MENIRTVNVQNMVRANVSIQRPEFGINRVWSDFGQVMKIPFDNLEQGMWDTAIRNLFTSGILYIESLKDKIDLGLEPAEAEEPVNIVMLDENKMANLLITHKLIDPDKCSWLKDLTGKDILKAISQKDDIARAEKKAKEAEQKNAVEGRR